MPIQQMLLGVGASEKTYLDDVFSTLLYTGNSSGVTINNGINLSENGGLVWAKRRDGGHEHGLYDTVRGVEKRLSIDTNAEETASTGLKTFTTTGFTCGNADDIGGNGDSYAAWTFRKAPGFFDCISYTGNSSSTQTVSHNLGCVPGMIMLKRTDSAGGNWIIYHRGINNYINPEEKNLELDTTDAVTDYVELWNDTAPTATNFVAGQWNNVNNATYIVYLFAGGDSPAATAKSGDFTGDFAELTIPSDTDFDLGTTFTIEFWMRFNESPTDWRVPIRREGSDYYHIQCFANGKIQWKTSDNKDCDSATGVIQRNIWAHYAFVCNNGTGQWYVNGTASGDPHTGITGDGYSGDFIIGGWGDGSSYYLNGYLSNLRIVKGTAVYTSSFKAPTEPLANISGTVLLCLNDSSITGATVTPGTITKTGTYANQFPTVTSNSPFDDPSGLVFGTTGKEGLIKCGHYKGNGSTDGPIIDLGWEPQWIMVKLENGTGSWYMFDTTRGIMKEGNDAKLMANEIDLEEVDTDWIDVTSTGFQLKNSNSNVNADHYSYIYTAIRRPDGYVSKPVETATSVFTMAVGNSSSSIPNYVSNFPVDFITARSFASSSDWYTATRLTGTREYLTNTNAAQGGGSCYTFDSSVGAWECQSTNASQAWMWKRHAGFDIVTYDGTSQSSLEIRHNLGVAPEMIWLKCRSEAEDWRVYHKGANGGSSGEDYFLKLNTNDAQSNNTIWNDTAPTSTHFSVGDDGAVNDNNRTYLAMLFASVSGISKVGVYSGANVSQSITCGFQPRFVIIKNQNDADDWLVLDTTRGWDSNDDKRLKLNDSGAQSDHAIGAPISTGFNLAGNVRNFNQAGRYYLFYAHA